MIQVIRLPMGSEVWDNAMTGLSGLADAMDNQAMTTISRVPDMVHVRKSLQASWKVLIKWNVVTDECYDGTDGMRVKR
jgi:hypothetical protein